MIAEQKRKDLEELPPPGSVLDQRYVVGRPLAVGGMGVVVAARDRLERRDVALKILRSSTAKLDEARVRLQREARLLLDARDENLVRVHDVRALASGEPYLVMELLAGTDLERMLRRRGPFAIGEAVGYVLQACAGLAAAHRLGVVHRDIKPSNLFLAHRPGSAPVLKVIDFGVCKAVSTGELSLTADQHVLGSPNYMSPEQCRASRDVDARTDVWSLGVVLHRLLTGRLPFESGAPAERMIRIVTAAPVPLRGHCPAAPEALERIVLRCLEKDRAARYASVADLARALAPLAAPAAREQATGVARLLRTTQVIDEETTTHEVVVPPAPHLPRSTPPAPASFPSMVLDGPRSGYPSTRPLAASVRHTSEPRSRHGGAVSALVLAACFGIGITLGLALLPIRGERVAAGDAWPYTALRGRAHALALQASARRPAAR